jgi:hypothetical protein
MKLFKIKINENEEFFSDENKERPFSLYEFQCFATDAAKKHGLSNCSVEFYSSEENPFYTNQKLQQFTLFMTIVIRNGLPNEDYFLD